MNTTDKRTGETFPSVTLATTVAGIKALAPGLPPDRRDAATDTLTALRLQRDQGILSQPNDWTLTLDPGSLMDYGYRHIGDAADDLATDRPVEWFHEVARRAKDALSNGSPEGDAMWEAVHTLLARLATETDKLLGFDASTELS